MRTVSYGPGEPVPFGDGVGLGSVLGDADGLGDGDRLGGGVGVALGAPEGDPHACGLAPEPDGTAHGDAVAGGDGYTVWLGPTEYPVNEGTGKATGGLLCIATDMKSCQIAAGIVPPYTEETPSTFASGISPAGQPIHTHVTICVV